MSGSVKRVERTDRSKMRSGAKKPYLLYFFLSIMFVWAVVSLVKGEYMAFLFKIGAFVMMSGVSAMMSKGLEMEEEYKRAVLARAPRVPYKSVSAIVLSLVIFYIGSLISHSGFWSTLFVSILGGVGAILYYGRDPAGDKLPVTGDVDPDILLRSLNEARDTLERIKDDNSRIHDRVLHERVEKSVRKAEEILDAIASDPRDMRSARKFLVVFIDGVAGVTSKYVAMDEKEIDNDTKKRLYDLLDDVSVRFQKELERLKSNEKFDLDVRIDVLKEQIKE